jgi:hypothetical protein
LAAFEVAARNRFFATILSLAEQPDFLRTAEADIKAAAALINETKLATFVFPPQGSLMHAIRRSEARLRGTQCLVALRRWQLQHAQPPPDIATLAKSAGMAGVPIAPYSGEPLRMTVIDGITGNLFRRPRWPGRSGKY